MDRNTFVKSLKENFSWILELGYSLRQIETNAYFEKHLNDEVYSINFCWAEYDVIKIHGIFAEKRFNCVETIIESRTNKSDHTIRKKWEGKIPKDFDSDANGATLTDAFYLSDENQIKLFSEIIRDFYTKEAQPFFDQFKNIRDILEWLEQHDIQEHSKLLVFSNNSMMLRKLIIMKMGKSNDYQNLYDRYRSFLKQKNEEKESPYIEMYNEFIKFDEFFNYPT